MCCCEACGSSRVKPLLQDLAYHYKSNGTPQVWYYQLLECKSCGLGFIDPKPSWELLQTFYGEDYGCYDGTKALPENEAESFKYQIAKLRYGGLASKGFRWQAIYGTGVGMLAEVLSGKTISYSLGIPLQLPENAFIFELGYGSGNWLLSMSKLGYKNLYGYDIDANPNNQSRLLEAGINVSCGEFLENGYPTAKFDCIRMEHVFEHLIEPIDVLKKCYKMLKPGGRLVMNFPCKNSLSFRMSPKYWAALDKPRHLYLHTESSACHFLQDTGFTVNAIKAYPVALVFGASINNQLRNTGFRIPSKVFSFLAPLYNLVGFTSRNGENITVLATR